MTSTHDVLVERSRCDEDRVGEKQPTAGAPRLPPQHTRTVARPLQSIPWAARAARVARVARAAARTPYVTPQATES